MRARAVSSLILRLGGVGGKFVVTFVLAREAGAHAVGEFALFFGAVNMLVFVIGLDIHLFSARELVHHRSRAGRLRVMVAQGMTDAGLYAVFVVAALFAYLAGVADILPIPLGWLIAIAIAHHLSLQLSRAFQMLRHANAANIIYAANAGLWGWVGSALLLAGVTPQGLEPFYVIWLATDIVAILGGLFLLRRMMRGVPASRPKSMRAWLVRGISVSRFFYVTSVSTMAIAYVDRFIIAAWTSVADAGTFAFWQSIAALLPIVTYAMAGMHFLPILVESYKNRRMDEFDAAAHSFLKQSLLLCLGTSALVLLVSSSLPVLVGRPEMAVGLPLVGLLLLGATGNTLWQVPYQVLYSAGEDRVLAQVLVALTLLSTAANVALVPFAGILGAALVGAATNLLIFVVLGRAAKRHLAISVESRQKPEPLGIMPTGNQ